MAVEDIPDRSDPDAGGEDLNEQAGRQSNTPQSDSAENVQQLEASLEKYAALFNFSPVGYVTLDNFGYIEEINAFTANYRRECGQRNIEYVLTRTDERGMVERCHKLGCSVYIVEPAEEDNFSEVVRRVGLFLLGIEVPKIGGAV